MWTLFKQSIPFTDWENHTNNFGSAWKIIRVGGQTSSYSQFEDLIRSYDREDLDALWTLVKEKSKSGELTYVKARSYGFTFRDSMNLIQVIGIGSLKLIT